jgi:hypothetical protein
MNGARLGRPFMPRFGGDQKVRGIALARSSRSGNQHLLELFRSVEDGAKRKLILSILRSLIKIITPDTHP